VELARRSLDRRDYGLRIRGVSLNGQRSNSERPGRGRRLLRFVGFTDVRQRDVGALARQALDHGGPDTPAAAGNQCPLALELLIHRIPPWDARFWTRLPL